jgi:hypothetical protein
MGGVRSIQCLLGGGLGGRAVSPGDVRPAGMLTPSKKDVLTPERHLLMVHEF